MPDITPSAQEALDFLTGIERFLWRWSIERGFERPDSRLSRMTPKYGTVAAAHSVVANMWLLPAMISFFVSLPLLEVHGASSALRGVGWVFVVLLIVSFAFTVLRIVTASRAGRRFARRSAVSCTEH
jgi:Na+/melibiose symporter-like transporter